MSDRSPSDHRLLKLVASISLNIALLSVSILWLAGQYSMLIGWAKLNTECSIRIDREGWIWQQTGTGLIGSMHNSKYGVRVRSYQPGEARSTAWQSISRNHDLSHPSPGVMWCRVPVAGPLQIRLVFVRHWLIVLLTVAVWGSCQFVLLRKRTTVVTAKRTRSA